MHTAQSSRIGKAAIEHAESYEALRTLLLEMDRENCELSTQYSIANIRHTLEHP